MCIYDAWMYVYMHIYIYIHTCMQQELMKKGLNLKESLVGYESVWMYEMEKVGEVIKLKSQKQNICQIIVTTMKLGNELLSYKKNMKYYRIP